MPRDAAAVLQMPAVNSAVRVLLAHPEGQLVIRYPGGDDGTLWAEELRAWLVALGVPSSRMELRPGSASAAQIDLLVSDAMIPRNAP